MMLVVEGFLKRLIGTIPGTASELASKIGVVSNQVGRENIDLRVFYRKMLGIATASDPDARVVCLDDFSPGDADDLVILPLNMDDTIGTVKNLLSLDKVALPVTHPVLNSKRARASLFPGMVPFYIHVPECSIDQVASHDFREHFESRGITHVMIKDDQGYHSGNVIPYVITPVKNVNERVKEFARKTSRVVDVGGIVVDEFIGGTVQDVFKVHVFGGTIPGELLEYRVVLSGLDGKFKTYDGTPCLLTSVHPSVCPGVPPPSIDDAARRAMPFAFSSIDYVIRDGMPVIVDVNSKAGSLGEVQDMGGGGNPFSYFVDKAKRLAKTDGTIEMLRAHVASIERLAAVVDGMSGITPVP